MKLVNFKASEEEIKRWKQEAWQEKMTFSAWVRERLNKAKAPALASLPSSSSSGPLKGVHVRSAGGCAHRLPKGSWCKSCGTIKK